MPVRSEGPYPPCAGHSIRSRSSRLIRATRRRSRRRPARPHVRTSHAHKTDDPADRATRSSRKRYFWADLFRRVFERSLPNSSRNSCPCFKIVL